MDELRQGRHSLQDPHRSSQDPRNLPQDHLRSQVQSSSSSSSNVDYLFNASIKNKQFRAIDFAKIGSFPYAGQIKPNNFNLALFSFGSFKHFT